MQVMTPLGKGSHYGCHDFTRWCKVWGKVRAQNQQIHGLSGHGFEPQLQDPDSLQQDTNRTVPVQFSPE